MELRGNSAYGGQGTLTREYPKKKEAYLWLLGGAEGDRTPGLVNAIHALSQLSYSPNVASNIEIPMGRINICGRSVCNCEARVQMVSLSQQ